MRNIMSREVYNRLKEEKGFMDIMEFNREPVEEPLPEVLPAAAAAAEKWEECKQEW